MYCLHEYGINFDFKVSIDYLVGGMAGNYSISISCTGTHTSTVVTGICHTTGFIAHISTCMVNQNIPCEVLLIHTLSECHHLFQPIVY